MANIRFNIEKKRDKSYLFVIFDYRPGCRFKMSIREKINPVFWDRGRQLVTRDHENAEFINKIIASVRQCLERCRVEAKARGIYVSPDELKAQVSSVVFPDRIMVTKPHSDLSQSAYFARFYDLMPDFVNLKDAYQAVENEWNERGVQMFPTYSAFRTGKTRFMSGDKKSFTKSVKAMRDVQG